jgi:hypothetical protein
MQENPIAKLTDSQREAIEFLADNGIFPGAEDENDIPDIPIFSPKINRKSKNLQV